METNESKLIESLTAIEQRSRLLEQQHKQLLSALDQKNMPLPRQASLLSPVAQVILLMLTGIIAVSCFVEHFIL